MANVYEETGALRCNECGTIVRIIGTPETGDALRELDAAEAPSTEDADDIISRIINPADLHGRVLRASKVELNWDGNQLSAMVGPNLVEGVPGFGDAVHDALRELADNLVKEGVWITEDGICALIASEQQRVGVAGFGYSVHDAVRGLAEKLVRNGVWVEVTSKTEWHIEEL
jgi:hypothetical protein